MRLATFRSAALVLSALAFSVAFGNRASAQQLAGVHVDADGVLRLKIHDDPDGQLNRQRLAQASATLNPEVAAKSPLRKVSLTRLERELAKRLGEGLRPTNEMLHLAGLARIKYVFFYPETKDVVIAGPAEAWAEDISGRVVNVSSGRPVLELQDLIVALRAYPPHEQNAEGKTKKIGCSIDPTKEGMLRMQQFLTQFGSSATPDDTDTIVNGLRESLGLQTVTVYGVSPKTHFAQVMVEADYRMKLIGIGLEQPPIRMTSYVDKARPGALGRNSLARWYFVPEYQCLRVSEDGLAMEMVGDGVKLVGANEMVATDGSRHEASRHDKASELFVSGFTKKYPQLAEKSAVFAQLRDVIDMSVAAAFIQEQDYYTKADWNLELFCDEAKFPVETHAAPTQVETAVTSIWKGSQLMTPLGGGVELRPEEALTSANLLGDKDGKVRQAREQTKLKLAAGQWWWD